VAGFFWHGSFHDVALLVVLGGKATVLNECAVAGWCVEGGDTVATAPELLCQRALRDHVELQLSCEVLALEEGVGAEVGGVHDLDLVALEELAEPVLVGAGVGAEAGQIFDLVLDEGVDELLGDAAEAEAA